MKSTKIFLLLLAIIVASLDAVAGGRYFSEFNDLSEWSTDRYAPNLFEQATFQNDARLHLRITDDAAERTGKSGTFYNTHGKQFSANVPVTNANGAVISGKLFLPSSWANNHRRSDIWGITQITGQTYLYYPIIGFANTTGSNPTFRAWNSNDGWHNVSYSITYDTWYDLSIIVEPTENKYYINGDLVYTEVLPIEDVQYNVQGIILQGYNFGDANLSAEEQSFNDDYDIYWDDIAVHSATDRVYNVTQTTTHDNIQPAINAATAGDYLRVLEGTFVQTGTLNINKALTIVGDSEAGCLIDVSTLTGYGIQVDVSDVKIKNFTALPNSATGHYLFKVSNDVYNIVFENITANASKKTPFDFHAVTNLTLTNLTATNTVGGNAISLTGCNNVTITGVTSSNNAWGGIAVYCSKPTYYNRASNNVNFDFTANDVEDALYIQNEFGLVSTNINISNWTYETANTPLTEYTFYTDGDLVEAYGFATYLNTRLGNTASVVKDNNSVYHVMPQLSIQAAIDAAAPGNTILVEAGNYTENVTIDKGLTVKALEAIKPVITGAFKLQNDNAITIDGFEFQNGASIGGTKGAVIIAGDNHTVKNCKLVGNPALTGAAYYGIHLEVGGRDNLTVEGNEFTAWHGGIYFNPSSGHNIINNNFHDNVYVGIGSDNISDVSISGNTFSGHTDAQWGEGIGVGGTFTNVVVSGNTFSNNTFHIRNWAAAGSGIVDAECNTFSTTVTSEIAAKMGGEVDFIPYIVNGNCIGGLPVHNITQNLHYMTIQEAIDAATAGDVIQVDAGTFIESGQIVIDKDLTISGAGENLTILNSDLTTSTSLYNTAAGWFYVTPGTSFILNDITLDGLTQIITTAIQSRGNTQVNNCTIKNIKGTKYYGLGIQFLSGNNNIVNNCTFENIERIGIHVRGNKEPNDPIATILNSTFTGSGTGDFCQYGIEFGGGGQGSVENCHISDYLGTESGWGSAGIIVTDYYGTGTNADITTSTIVNNNVGLHVGYNETDLSIATIHNCEIDGNIDYGVYSTNTKVDAINNWWGDCSGPEVASNIGGVGDKLTDNVDYYPWTQGDCSGYNIMVKLIDSKNNPIPDQVAQIRNGSYIAANTNQFGYITANIPQYYTYVKMTHLGKTETKLGVFNRDPIVIYQTKEVTVNFKDSYGNDLVADELLYRDGTGALIPMATNASTASIEMLPLSFDFQAKYLGFAQTVTQNVKNAQTVDFGTIAVNLSLKDSDGNPLAAEDLAYRNVEGNYVSVAQNADNHTLEMLPLSYYFQATYLGFGQPLFQNTADDATIEFQTKQVIVSLANSTGNPLEADELYYRDANYNYVSLGTNISGDTLEMLPLSYYFKAKYLGYAQTKQQNVTNNQAVNFQTVLVSFNLVDGSNTPLNGTAIYRNGYASYVPFGSTGQTPETMEMLPLYYYFRCTYNGKTKTKLWNVNNNPNVLFTYDGSNLFKEAEAGEEFVSDWSGISTKSYPTPFSTVLNIEYTTTEDADVTIEIFDVAGRKVRTLESSFVSNGSHTTTWDGTSDSGNILESGTYYYVIIAGENTQTGIISFVK